MKRIFCVVCSFKLGWALFMLKTLLVLFDFQGVFLLIGV